MCGGAGGRRQPDVGRWTALVWAARFGHEREAELLIGAKANVEAKDTGGYGPSWGRLWSVQHLVGRSGPSPTSAERCVRQRHGADVIAALLAADAKPDATNDYGCRPRLRSRSRIHSGQQRAGADGGTARRDTAEGLARRVGKAAEYADAVRKVPNRSVSSGAACECRGRSALGRRSSLNSTNRTRARRRRAQAARAKVLRRALRREKAEVRGQFRPRILQSSRLY